MAREINNNIVSLFYFVFITAQVVYQEMAIVCGKYRLWQHFYSNKEVCIATINGEDLESQHSGFHSNSVQMASRSLSPH